MCYRSALIAVPLAISLSTSAAALEICATCDETLALDAQEWACLLADLGFYLSVPTEPVFVSLFGCDADIEITDSLRGDSVDLSMTGAESAPYVPAMRLTHGQLQCLADLRASLEKELPESFDFLADCAAPAPEVD